MKFALIGAAGYIAPKHMKAIRDTGNELVFIVDKNDSVGVIDRYFDDVPFCRSIADIDYQKTDYLSVCTPNYLHFSHIINALASGCDVICEKPIVLTEVELDSIKKYAYYYGQKVYTILQLRLHPQILLLKKHLGDGRHKVRLRYVTKRGPWYFESWKGDVDKSGGVVTNIGIHLFDLLLWLFGGVKDNTLQFSDDKTISGRLILERADVEWQLSVDKDYGDFQRVMIVDDIVVDFTEGMGDLHTESYKQILEGNGFGLDDARPSIVLTEKLREMINAKETNKLVKGGPEVTKGELIL